MEGAGEGQIFLGDPVTRVVGAKPEGHLIPDIMDFRVVPLLLRDGSSLVNEDQGGLEILKPIGLQQLRAFKLPARQTGQARLDLFGGQDGAHENTLFRPLSGVNAGLREDPYCE